jgi:hypothetical protein
MTKVKENFLTEGLSGKYGNKVVFRQMNGQTILCRRPQRFRPPTANQQNHKALFLEAVDYAQRELLKPEVKAEYRRLAPPGVSPYNMAVADFISPPHVDQIDTSGYSGVPGEEITIYAVDKIKVKRVTVKIVRADQSIVEQGQAEHVAEGRLWVYQVTVENNDLAGCMVTATAVDMPGHEGVATVNL